jgi:hypothetical protein
MKHRPMKTVGVILLALVCFYGLQYVATEIHFACQVPEEDCPPPFYWAGEFIYRIMTPAWLPDAR